MNGGRPGSLGIGIASALETRSLLADQVRNRSNNKRKNGVRSYFLTDHLWKRSTLKAKARTIMYGILISHDTV